MKPYQFFTTYGCHLCEQAWALLAEIEQQHPGLQAQFEIVEIGDSEALVERYGIRIPVLRRCDSGAELGWPFDADLLTSWLELPAQPPEGA